VAIWDLKYKAMVDGNDRWATVMAENVPHKNDHGIEMKSFLIVPQKDTIDAYPYFQKPGILNIPTPRGMGMWVEYPTTGVVDYNNSMNNAIVRIDWAFDGKETPLNNRNKHLKRVITEQQMDLDNVEMSNIALTDENRELRDELILKVQQVADMMKILKGDANVEETTQNSDTNPAD